MTKNIVIAVDATQRSLDALALGKVLADALKAPVRLVSVFPYDPLRDPEGDELTRVRAEARSIMLELAEKADVDVAHADVIAQLGRAGASACKRGGRDGHHRRGLDGPRSDWTAAAGGSR